MYVKTLMLFLILSLLATAGCQGPHKGTSSDIKSGGVPTGQFRGLAAIESKLRDKISPFIYLGRFIQIHDVSAIAPLLGFFTGSSGNVKYSGGNPGPVSMFLWKSMLGGLVNLYNCDGFSGVEKFHQIRENICTKATPNEKNSEPAPEPEPALDKEDLRALWNHLVGHEAPAGFEIWSKEVLSAKYDDANDGFETILYTLLMNPYFLLEY